MKIRCIVVDDEPLARNGIEENIKDLDYLELLGSAESFLEANKLLQLGQVDLMFLDINMPRVSGIEFLKLLKEKPMVIIISAYSEYALEGFELEVIDYLVKPVPYDRFMKATQKAKEYFDLKTKNAQSGQENYFFVKTEHKYEKIFFDDVLFIEAADNYVYIHTLQKKQLIYVTIKIIADNLPQADFIKVHKSYIVSISKINSIEGNEITVDKHKIPISRALKDEIMGKIVNRNLLKRS